MNYSEGFGRKRHFSEGPSTKGGGEGGGVYVKHHGAKDKELSALTQVEYSRTSCSCLWLCEVFPLQKQSYKE